jgi:cytochrome c oxidase subunit 4
MAHDSSVRGEGPPEEPGGHVASVALYLVVYAALIVFTATTVGAAFLDLGPLNDAVAVGIALVKALLVVLFFMHVRWSPRLIPLTALAGFFWLVHLFGGTLSDYFTRGLLGVPGR